MKAYRCESSLNLEGKSDCGQSDVSQSSLSTLTPSDLSLNELQVRRRKRKNSSQMQILTLKFEENPRWSKDLIFELSETTGLTQAQVYKWNWDHQKKVRAFPCPPSEVKVQCNESLSPFSIDEAMFVSQRLYKIEFSAFEP